MTNNVELKPTTLNPAFREQWRDVEAAEALSKTRREEEAKNNPPGPPTDDQLRAEWSTLEQSYQELTHYAAQSEASTNAQGDHVRVVEKRLKTVEALIPEEDIREDMVARYVASLEYVSPGSYHSGVGPKPEHRVYRHLEACRGIVALREVFKDATEIFARRRKISADWATRKAAFEQHNLPRLQELRKIVNQQDNDYATAKGRKSVWQY